MPEEIIIKQDNSLPSPAVQDPKMVTPSVITTDDIRLKTMKNMVELNKLNKL